MEESTRNQSAVPTRCGSREIDPLHEHLRGWVRSAVEALLAAELEAVVQAARYARPADGARAGYRHAGRERVIATSLGPTSVRVPRARLFDAAGAPSVEWQSTMWGGINGGRG